jgi:hypothetical protein
MKKSLPYYGFSMNKKPAININDAPGVNVPEALHQKARRLEEDPEKILALVDLLFLGTEEERLPS